MLLHDKDIVYIILRGPRKDMVSATPKNAHRIYGQHRVPFYANIQSVI